MLVDGTGVRLSETALGYTLWTFLERLLPAGMGDDGPSSGGIALSDAALEEGDFWRYCHNGLLRTGALWAMTLAPLAVVAALRETSILFGALIAWLLLKERVAGLSRGRRRDCRRSHSVTPVLEHTLGNICCRFLFTYPAVQPLSIPACHLAFFFSVVDFTRIYGNTQHLILNFSLFEKYSAK